MSESIFTSIVAASSALLGSSIPVIVSMLKTKNDRAYETKSKLLDTQKEVYHELMLALQNMISYQAPDEMVKFQKATLNVAIYGDDITAKKMNEYYLALMAQETSIEKKLTREEHVSFHTDIINGIRSNLGMDKLDKFEIVGFKHPDYKPL